MGLDTTWKTRHNVHKTIESFTKMLIKSYLGGVVVGFH